MDLDGKVLQAIERAGGIPVEKALIAARCAAGLEDVQAAIERLASQGHTLEVSDALVRLAVEPRGAADVFGSRCGLRLVGRTVYKLPLAGSTNDIALGMAEAGCEEGTVVWAEGQTGGRGRFSRRWVSPVGAGVWMSVVLRPGRSSRSALTLMAAVAVCEAVSAMGGGGRVFIRWPNDILVAGRKLGGILTEACGTAAAVVGIGLDVCIDEAQLPRGLRGRVCSLVDVVDGPVDVREAALAVLRSLDEWYPRLRDEGFSVVHEAWRRRSSTLGSHVRIRSGGRVFTGLAVGLDDDGALLVRTGEGFVRRMTAGEVRELEVE